MSAHRQSLGVAPAWAECAGLSTRRPLPGHQPVLPQLRLQGRHPGVPAERGDDGAAGGLRRGRGDAAGRGGADHRAARAAHHLPDHARPPRRHEHDLSTLRLAVTGRGHRSGRAGRADAARAELRHRADRLRPDRGGGGHDVPARRRPGDRVATTSGRAAAGMRGAPRRPATRSCCAAQRDARLPRRPGGDRARPSTPTAGCTPATSARLDERGYLDITDRLKDMYICGGFNVYPGRGRAGAGPARRGRRVGRHRRARRRGWARSGKASSSPRPGSHADRGGRARATAGAPRQLQGARASVEFARRAAAQRHRQALKRAASEEET